MRVWDSYTNPIPIIPATVRVMTFVSIDLSHRKSLHPIIFLIIHVGKDVGQIMLVNIPMLVITSQEILK